MTRYTAPSLAMTVTILGSGSWGTALALILARNGHDTILVGRDQELADQINAARENMKYLPGFVLPANASATTLDSPKPQADLTVIAVPSKAVETVMDWVPETGIVVVASKGLAPEGSGLLTDLIAVDRPNAKLVVLSGPNLSKELAQGIPTAAVVAGDDSHATETARVAFLAPSFRVYRTDDLRGVEIAGALKNVVAICAGASDGLGYGDNTKGALVARGLNEMARLGLALGGQLETFLGIAGVGDLFATASSRLSRNYRVGYALGQGSTIEQALASIDGQVAEGVQTCEIALELARKHQVHLPIFEALYGVMNGKMRIRDAVGRLIERTTPEEGLVKRD